MFSAGPFLCVFDKCLLKCPNYAEPPLSWRISGCIACTQAILFAKHSILNVWQCSEYASASI